jgi:hypothetical protein
MSMSFGPQLSGAGVISMDDDVPVSIEAASVIRDLQDGVNAHGDELSAEVYENGGNRQYNTP